MQGQRLDLPAAGRRGVKLFGCGIFRAEVAHLRPDLARDTDWLSPGLHTDLQALGQEIEATAGAGPAVAFLGAACHPDLANLARDLGHLPGKDCVAAFLSEDERREFETRKAFVMTPGWLQHWREIFAEGLGWDEVDAHQNFGFYDAIVLLDFGLETLDDLAVLAFFEYTGKVIEIVPANLERFRDHLTALCGPPAPP